MAKTFRAVYKDGRGATFSAPVEKMPDGSWVMHSADGLQLPINFHFNDDAAGRLTFVEYREVPEPAGLRLHLPDRIGTESSFQQLQRAYIEKEVVAQRQHRQAARTEIQKVAPDPKTQARERAAKEHAVQVLHARKPNGRGVGLVIGENE